MSYLLDQGNEIKNLLQSQVESTSRKGYLETCNQDISDAYACAIPVGNNDDDNYCDHHIGDDDYDNDDEDYDTDDDYDDYDENDDKDEDRNYFNDDNDPSGSSKAKCKGKGHSSGKTFSIDMHGQITLSHWIFQSTA